MRTVSWAAIRRLKDSNVSLLLATYEFPQYISQSGWLDDFQDNRVQGFGKGESGKVHALAALRDAVEKDALYGVLEDQSPVGFCLMLPDAASSKISTVSLFVAPEFRKTGVSARAAVAIADKLFANGVYRVQCQVLTINSDGTKFAHRLGMIPEGKHRASWWMDNNPYDFVTYRLLRKDWEHMVGRRGDQR